MFVEMAKERAKDAELGDLVGAFRRLPSRGTAFGLMRILAWIVVLVDVLLLVVRSLVGSWPVLPQVGLLIGGIGAAAAVGRLAEQNLRRYGEVLMIYRRGFVGILHPQGTNEDTWVVQVHPWQGSTIVQMPDLPGYRIDTGEESILIDTRWLRVRMILTLLDEVIEYGGPIGLPPVPS
jgi:hypothetical protein